MELALDSTGPSDGRPVVLMHGLSSSRSTYRDVVPRLVADGCRVLNVDLRGHGGSGPGSRYRASDYAADVVELLESERAPAVLVGHSLGGVTASAVAAGAPGLVAGLFLEDPPLFEGDEAVRAASPAARFFPEFVAAIRGWQGRGASVAEVAAALGAQPSPHGGTALARLGPAAMETRARSILDFDAAAMDAAISGETWVDFDPTAPMPCPVTIVAADPTVGAVFLPDHGRRYRAAVPQAAVEVIDGQAHGIHDDPAGRGPYLDALGRFLASIT